ncbi:MmgE/PrpD family protein [Paenirhodobacter populi]|nr:MmgE/PrpD family protein [Sinirhodobacter populi]
MPQRKGFHPTSAVGRVGAATVAVVPRGLGAAQARNALSSAATGAG